MVVFIPLHEPRLEPNLGRFYSWLSQVPPALRVTQTFIELTDLGCSGLAQQLHYTHTRNGISDEADITLFILMF